MAFTEQQIERLRQEIDRALVASRTERNDTFLYLEGFTVIEQLNDIFEFDWSSSVSSINVERTFTVRKQDYKTKEWSDQERTLYRAVVSVTAGGVCKEDVGTGLTANEKPESHEMAIKGAVTDAFKRATRQFGNQFGNSLYDKHSAENAAMKSGSKKASTPSAPKASQSQRTETGTPLPCEVEGCEGKVTGYDSRRDGNYVTIAMQADAGRRQADGKAKCLKCLASSMKAAA